MINFQVINLEQAPWDKLDALSDRSIFQTRPWLEFLKSSQGIKPIVIEIKKQDQVIGYFTGGLFCAVGHNMKKILAHLKRFFVYNWAWLTIAFGPMLRIQTGWESPHDAGYLLFRTD